MAYVQVPKDLNAVKTKVLFNLTKRSLSVSAAVRSSASRFSFCSRAAKMSASGASICMVLVMLPFFLMAVYEKNGLPLEKIVRNIIRCYSCARNSVPIRPIIFMPP